jgi:hypothetical protein
MLSAGSNRVKMPELLCYANISELSWSGYHIDIKVTKNNFLLSYYLNQEVDDFLMLT